MANVQARHPHPEAIGEIMDHAFMARHAIERSLSKIQIYERSLGAGKTAGKFEDAKSKSNGCSLEGAEPLGSTITLPHMSVIFTRCWQRQAWIYSKVRPTDWGSIQRISGSIASRLRKTTSVKIEISRRMPPGYKVLHGKSDKT